MTSAADGHFQQLLAHSLAAAINKGARQAIHEAQKARSIDDSQVSLREMQHRVRNDMQSS